MISRPIAIGVIGTIVVIIAFVLNYSNDKDPIEQQTSKSLVLKQEKQLTPPSKQINKTINHSSCDLLKSSNVKASSCLELQDRDQVQKVVSLNQIRYVQYYLY